MGRTIAISSSYGSDGDAIGRTVAKRLDLEFIDRAIPVEVARHLAVDLQEAVANEERVPGRMERVLAQLVNAWMPYFASEQADLLGNLDAYRIATETVLRRFAEGPGGVLLGRAAVIVLAEQPDVLRVRLDGPVEARIRQVAARRGLDEAAARNDQRETDAARAAYARTFYGRSLDDIHLYHVVLDRTALSRAACIDIVVRAAKEFFAESTGDALGP